MKKSNFNILIFDLFLRFGPRGDLARTRLYTCSVQRTQSLHGYLYVFYWPARRRDLAARPYKTYRSSFHLEERRQRGGLLYLFLLPALSSVSDVRRSAQMQSSTVGSIVGETDGEEKESEEHAETLQLPCGQQQLKPLELMKRIVEAHSLDSRAILSGLRKGQGAVHSMMLSSAKQIAIDKIFK